MWKNVVEPDRPQMKTWRMRIACWIPKATNTHSQYVILIVFPLQQRLNERACLVTSSDGAWTRAPEALRPADISLLVLATGRQSWFCVLSHTYCTSPWLQSVSSNEGDNWQGGGIDAFGEVLAPALLCPPQIRQNLDLSSENPMASRVSYGMADYWRSQNRMCLQRNLMLGASCLLVQAKWMLLSVMCDTQPRLHTCKTLHEMIL